jgi:valyl-tRNA synthetase
MRLARMEGFEPVLSMPAGGVPAIVDGATMILCLGDVLDLPREKARLGKEIGKLDAELTKIAAKLANPDFLAKAKAEIVEEQREREADISRDRDRIRAAYDRLTAI